MRQHYDDLRELTNKPPVWFDNNGVPRYRKFVPYDVPNIYADEAALYHIECQQCRTIFFVSADDCRHGDIIRGSADPHEWPLANAIETGKLHYGDPPNIWCCMSGPTMNCMDIVVREYWRRDPDDYVWQRMPEYERLLADHPSYAPSTGDASGTEGKNIEPTPTETDGE